MALVALLIAFTVAQMYEMLRWAGIEGPSTKFWGYTIHHAYYGIALICIAGWLSIYYRNRKVNMISSVLFGGGIGLFFSEIGLILTHFRTHWDGLIYNWTVIWGLLLLIFVFFEDFWKSIRGKLDDLSEEESNEISKIEPLIDTLEWLQRISPSLKKTLAFFAVTPWGVTLTVSILQGSPDLRLSLGSACLTLLSWLLYRKKLDRK